MIFSQGSLKYWGRFYLARAHVLRNEDHLQSMIQICAAWMVLKVALAAGVNPWPQHGIIKQLKLALHVIAMPSTSTVRGSVKVQDIN